MTHTLAAALEQTILDHRLMNVDVAWADDIVFPYYEGLSIRNLAHTVTRLLNERAASARIGASPLDERLWAHLQGDVRRVVLFITDGLGWQLLQDIIAEDLTTAQVVADLTGEGTLVPITSIAPSTTAAALPCIWTGTGPAGTGMVGTVLFLREFSTLVSMLHYCPVRGQHRSEVLEDWGLDFNNFLPPMTLAEVLNTWQIKTYLLTQKDLLGTGLSRLMHRGVKRPVRYYGYTDLWLTLRDLLINTRRERCFINVYWPAVDGISHLYGTVSEQSVIEVRRQLTDLRDTLATRKVGDKHTLFMLAADHGHTPITDVLNVTEHAPVLDGLRSGLGGDGRFAHLYLRADHRDVVRDYLRAHCADQVAVLEPAAALRAGLFGPDDVYPEAEARLGDLSLLAREGVAISEQALPTFAPLSRHAGLSACEMLVPLLMRMI